MTNLLVMREHLKRFYSKYEAYITPVGKFLLAAAAILLINSEILILSLICSFMPMNFIVFVAAAVTLGHLYELSMECALVALAEFLILFILYIRFSPKDTLAVLLTPICFILKIPYIMPIAMGLVGTPVSAVSVASGVAVYYTVGYMTQSASILGTFEEDGSLEKFKYVIDGMMKNKEMFIAIAGFVLTLLVVYFIRRLSIDYAWTVAMITGALLDILVLLFGDLMYSTNVSILGVILGSVASVAIAKVLEFFVFNVDYSRTELVQFEDDEYYYYVKAVPKNTVAMPQKRVKTIRVPEKAVKQQKRN